MIQSVSMFRDARSAGGRELFSCSLPAWHVLQKLGVTFGWNPSGTTYWTRKDQTEPSALRDYEPGETPDAKCIQHDDAIAWAASLQAARRESTALAQMQDGMDSRTSNLQISNERLVTLIDEFSAYAFRGSFAFMLADPE